MRGYTLHLKILRGGVVAKEAAVRCIWECGRGGFRGVTDPHLSIIGPPPFYICSTWCDGEQCEEMALQQVPLLSAHANSIKGLE